MLLPPCFSCGSPVRVARRRNNTAPMPDTRLDDPRKASVRYRCGGPPRMSEMDGYRNEELRDPSLGRPERGEYCSRCKSTIPVFLDLSAEDRVRLKDLACQYPVEAMRERRAATGCSYLWAKIWVQHQRGIRAHEAKTIQCFYCRSPLRTPQARQCLECGMDWHDRGSVLRRCGPHPGSPPPASAREVLPPPPEIDRAALMAWAIVDEAVRPTGRARHVAHGKPVDPISRVVLARLLVFQDPGVYTILLRRPVDGPNRHAPRGPPARPGAGGVRVRGSRLALGLLATT